MNKSFIISILFFLIPAYLIAQKDNGILKVTGEASMDITPDEAVARFELSAIRMEYNETVQIIGKKADDLLNALKKFGFQENEVKTSDFSVSINYVYTRNQRQDSGYVAQQIMEVTFPYESDRIIGLIHVVSVSSSEPQLSFLFRLSDQKQQEIKEKLISMAVKNARATAEAISTAAGTEITGIEEIVYGNQGTPGPQLFRMKEASSQEEPAFGGFHVQDQTFNESLQISYRIKTD